MKHYIFSILSLLLFVSSAEAQQFNQDTATTPPQPQGQQGWVQVPSGSTGPVNSLSFPTRDTAFAWGDTPLRSVDGGLTWQGFVTPVAMLFQFVDGQHGFTAGPSSHTAYHTSDGGANWTSANDSDQLVQLVCAVTPDTCFLGGDIYVSRTTDAGKTWQEQELNIATINGLSFYDSKHGVVVGGVGVGPFPHVNQTAGCFTTSDGGVTWVQLYTGSGDQLVGAAYVSNSTIVAVGGIGYMTRTRDGGLSWDSIVVKPSNYWDAISGKGGRFLAVGWGGSIITSLDSGLSWQQQLSGTTVNLSAIAMYDENNAIASGLNGTILKTSDGGVDWVQISPPSTIPLQASTFPEPSAGPMNFSYTLPQLQDVTISIYDMTGKAIATPLVKDLEQATQHTLLFDGSQFPAGVYNYQIQTERYHASGKFTIVR
jgi:photosystem II stability/assembly factor-like uncharacterized protein